MFRKSFFIMTGSIVLLGFLSCKPLFRSKLTSSDSSIIKVEVLDDELGSLKLNLKDSSSKIKRVTKVEVSHGSDSDYYNPNDQFVKLGPPRYSLTIEIDDSVKCTSKEPIEAGQTADFECDGVTSGGGSNDDYAKCVSEARTNNRKESTCVGLNGSFINSDQKREYDRCKESGKDWLVGEKDSTSGKYRGSCGDLDISRDLEKYQTEKKTKCENGNNTWRVFVRKNDQDFGHCECGDSDEYEDLDLGCIKTVSCSFVQKFDKFRGKCVDSLKEVICGDGRTWSNEDCVYRCQANGEVWDVKLAQCVNANNITNPTANPTATVSDTSSETGTDPGSEF